MSTENSGEVIPHEPLSYETQLQECLTSIHESSRVASEINALEVKLNSLSSIKATLVSGDNLSNATLDQLNKTIAEVETSIAAKKAEMSHAEQVVINGFLDVMNGIAAEGAEKSGRVVESMKTSLSQFGSNLRKEFKESFANNEERILELESGKMNVADKEALQDDLKTFKNDLLAVQKSNMAGLMAKQSVVLKELTQNIESISDRSNPETISANVYSRVMEQLDPRLRGQLELLQNLQRESKATSDSLESKIDHIVKKELDQQITPSNIQKIIQSLPEYELMQKAGKQLAEASKALTAAPVAPPPAPVAPVAAPIVDIANHPSLIAIKESVLALTAQITELKQSNESTRSMVDAIREKNVSVSAAPTDVDFQASVKHMEKMEKEVTLIHNHIKMIETVVNLKSKEMEEVGTDLTVGRKRPRLEEESTEVELFSRNSDDYLARLTEIETKHQKLLDFIVQCKDTILDEQFPTKIEAAMSKIEQILMNHEKFIAFLIDPFSTSKTVSIPTTTETNSIEMLSPSMIDAISQLVKQTAEKIALPLHKKIKFLEDKLESRSSSS